MQTLASGTRVRNIQGTSQCAPIGYDTWKQFYESECSWPSTCRILSCGNCAQAGAHVSISGQDGVWIIPMCAEHNHPNNLVEMPVNANTIAVNVDTGFTSGPPGICYGY
jgi:hypothetical protein